MNPNEWSAHDTIACAAWCDAHEDELLPDEPPRDYESLRDALVRSWTNRARDAETFDKALRRANARADRARHALVLVAVCCLAAGVCVGVIAR